MFRVKSSLRSAGAAYSAEVDVKPKCSFLIGDGLPEGVVTRVYKLMWDITEGVSVAVPLS